MSLRLTKTNSNKGVVSLSSTYGTPFTMACWFYPAATGITGVVISASIYSPASLFELYQHTDNKWHLDTMTQSSAASTASVVPGTWVSLVVVCASATSRQLYVNGTLDINHTTSATDTVNALVIGAQYISGYPESNGDGYFQDVALWSRALSSAEISALSKGFSPQTMPYLLRSYVPCLGLHNPEAAVSGGNMTLTGTIASRGSNIRCIRPT